MLLLHLVNTIEQIDKEDITETPIELLLKISNLLILADKTLISGEEALRLMQLDLLRRYPRPIE